MPLPPHIKARIEQLQGAMPKQPIRDGAVAHAGRERAEIAELFLQAGDEASASDWYLEAARFSHASGDVMGAVPLVKRALRHRPGREDAAELYAALWKLLGLGDTPEPVR